MAANGFREAATLMEGEAEGQIVTNTKGGGEGAVHSAGGGAFTGPGHRSGLLAGSPGRRELDQEASFL